MLSLVNGHHQSLGSQSDDGIDAARPSSRQVARGERDDAEERRDDGKSERIGSADAEQLAREQARRRRRGDEADEQCDRRRSHPLAQHHAKDLAAPRA